MTSKEVIQTQKSFEYQWKNIPDGAFLLSDNKFRENIEAILLNELQLSISDLTGKSVIDAGCGNGRWSYGFAKLGCDVTAFDYSASAVETARKNTSEFNSIKIIPGDVLDPPLKPESADLVYCWGVLHHTGNLPLGFEKVAALVKKGGILHIFVYGEKNKKMVLWRKILKPFSLKTRENIIKWLIILGRNRWVHKLIPFSGGLHGNFDAYSPTINTESTDAEIAALFKKHGFSSKKIIPTWCNAAQSPDVHMQGVKQ